MSQIQDIRVFSEGMDLDSDPRYISPKATREQRNIRYDDVANSSSGSSCNIKGNTLLLDPVISSTGENTKVGSCFDHKRNRMIYFTYNTEGRHRITWENVDSHIVGVLLWQDHPSLSAWRNGCDLNFDPDLVVEAEVVGDTLFWNSRNNPPRSLNLLKVTTEVGRIGSYPYIDDSVIDAIKHPPLNECGTMIVTDASIKVNNIRGSSYQFKYRWVYDDYGKSVCSPTSKPVIPKSGYAYNGVDFSTSVENNAIDITVETGSCAVSYIDILARKGNSGDWFIAKTINKSDLGIKDNVIYTWRFFNNSAITAVDQKDINRPFDYLPKRARSQAFIDGKYMAYGGCTEGFNNIVPKGELWVEYEKLPTAISGTTYLQLSSSSYVLNFRYPPGHGVFVSREIEVVFCDSGIIAAIDDTYMQSVEVRLYKDTELVNSRVLEYSVNQQFLNDPVGKLMAYINSDFSDIARAVLDLSPLVFPHVPDPFPLDSSELAVLPANFYSPSDELWRVDVYVKFSQKGSGPVTRIFGGAKTGAYHRFALAYSDAQGKISTAQCSDDFEIYVKAAPEVAYGETTAQSNDFRSVINWRIQHDPPDWAERYHWLYAGRRDIGVFKQYVIGGSDQAIYTIPGDDSYVYIDLSLLNKLTFKGNPEDPDLVVDFPISSSMLEPYIFNKGDRIRFITKPFNHFIYGPNPAFDVYPLGFRSSDVVDLEILGYLQDEDGSDTNVIRVQKFNYSTSDINKGSLVEIYTPNNSYSDEVYWEIGETYDIATVNGVRKHIGQNGSTSDPCGSFDVVDVVHIMRSMPYKLDQVGNDTAGQRMFWVESDSFCDFFESPVSVNGRINYRDVEAREKYSDIIRRSLAYYENTKTNGLNSFEYDKYLPVDARFGFINKIVQVGYTLKIIQDRKITSVYIGKNGLRQAGDDGRQVVVATDSVFNTTNPSEEKFGCSNPESIVVDGRNIYFYDAVNKCLVIDDPNGPSDLSLFGKVSSWVRNISLDVAKVFAGVNENYGEVYFTFVSSEGNINTIVFSTRYRNFKCFMDLLPSGFSANGYANGAGNFYLLTNGRVYLQDSSSEYGVLCGEDVSAMVTLVSNINPVTVKVANSIVVNSNKKWWSPRYGDIEIPVSDNQPIGMISKILDASFESVEGVWYSPFMKNAVTRSVFPNLYDLINGDELRGQYLFVTLRNNDRDFVNLHSVIVNWNISPLTR